MKVDRALERLGGVATAAELRRLCPWPQIRTATRRGEVVRDSHGRYSLPHADEARRAANRLSGLLALQSAALAHGWKVKIAPASPVVAVPRNRKVSAERRAGVCLLYVDLRNDEVVDGLTAYVRTVMDCASRLPFDEALAIADSALRAGDVTKAELRLAADRMPARYRGRCQRVAEAADGRAANPFESTLRAIAEEIAGLAVEPQVWIGHRRVDLADERLRLVIEAESFEFHGARSLLKRDCERYNDFAVQGWLVVRFSWEHVMFQPAYVVEVLRGAVRLLSDAPNGRALATGGARPAA